MKSLGSKRTLHDCRVFRAGFGKKILFTTGVKSKKYGRVYTKQQAQYFFS